MAAAPFSQAARAAALQLRPASSCRAAAAAGSSSPPPSCCFLAAAADGKVRAASVQPAACLCPPQGSIIYRPDQGFQVHNKWPILFPGRVCY